MKGGGILGRCGGERQGGWKSPHPRPAPRVPRPLPIPQKVTGRGGPVVKFELAINCARFLLPPSQCWERGQGGEGLSLPTTYTLQTTTYALLPQVWYLTADIGCWAGLMPHVHGVEV